MGSRPVSLDIGLVLLVFGSSFGLTQIRHRLVQYPVILDGYPFKIYINHGQEVYISDIPPAVEEVYGNIPRGPQARGAYSHKPPNTSRWYITDIHRLDMVHIILYIMLNFDEVYISDIPPHSS